MFVSCSVRVLCPSYIAHPPLKFPAQNGEGPTPPVEKHPPPWGVSCVSFMGPGLSQELGIDLFWDDSPIGSIGGYALPLVLRIMKSNCGNPVMN